MQELAVALIKPWAEHRLHNTPRMSADLKKLINTVCGIPVYDTPVDQRPHRDSREPSTHGSMRTVSQDCRQEDTTQVHHLWETSVPSSHLPNVRRLSAVKLCVATRRLRFPDLRLLCPRCGGIITQDFSSNIRFFYNIFLLPM
ncbi:uncharacterized protein LOC143037943 [Oratosquilla oratoria]|uniref:uncharacterized protein LOC143037943 n=1 Tax=Oratosquilla oratoria TaxID=337810 RepID=UPI003F76F6E6